LFLVTPVCDKILSSKMTIKVYGSKQSTCTQRVVLALHEKEIFDYELVTVDLQKGEQKRPEFLQLQVTRRILLL
jgi:glutathione S-transferase